MRQILSRSVLTVAAASGILAVSGGYASADSDAQSQAGGSPGVLSGNSVSAPIEVPVNVCGNTVDAAAALNPAFGNSCANVSVPAPPRPTPQHEAPKPQPTPEHHEQAPPPRHDPHTLPAPREVPTTNLAETGNDGARMAAASASAGALLLGGALLYRRGRRPAPVRAHAHAHARA